MTTEDNRSKDEAFGSESQEEQHTDEARPDNEVKSREIKFGEPYPHPHAYGYEQNTRTRTRKHSKLDYGESLTVIPVEIELDSMLYTLIQEDILKQISATADTSFEEWVNVCFKERMEQIITDPKEFGKVVLNPIRRAHFLAAVDIGEE